MQIVIEIPEERYEEYKRIGDSRDILFEAIRKGTSLPETYGELIERDKVLKSLVDYVDGKKSLGQCIDDVPTIIKSMEVKNASSN